jgi:hypothetical protein
MIERIRKLFLYFFEEGSCKCSLCGHEIAMQVPFIHICKAK